MSSGLRMTEDQVAEHVCRVRGGIRHGSSASRGYRDGTEPPTKQTPKQPKKIPTEHEEQVAFVTWFRLNYPDVRIIAIPNGGARHPKTAADLKAEGVSPGVPDLFVPAWSLWIEMKRRKGGHLSKEQTDWIAYLRVCGYNCIVARGAEDAIEQLEGTI
jgi:hypothetical protein